MGLLWSYKSGQEVFLIWPLFHFWGWSSKQPHLWVLFHAKLCRYRLLDKSFVSLYDVHLYHCLLSWIISCFDIHINTVLASYSCRPNCNICGQCSRNSHKTSGSLWIFPVFQSTNSHPTILEEVVHFHHDYLPWMSNIGSMVSIFDLDWQKRSSNQKRLWVNQNHEPI